MNALKVNPDSSFAAFGGGAVGLSAVMAALAADATTIISADVVPSRLDLTMQLLKIVRKASRLNRSFGCRAKFLYFILSSFSKNTHEECLMEKKKESPPPYSNFDQLLINGQWRHGKGVKVLSDSNPYNGNVLVEIPHANRDDMNEANRGAAKAQLEWTALLPSKRAAIMRRAAHIMEARPVFLLSFL